MIRKHRGHFAALACEKKLEELWDEFLALDDPMTDHYGAGDVVIDSYLRRERAIVKRYGFISLDHVHFARG